MPLKYNNNIYTLNRYPETSNKSLKAFSNAEILALDFIKDKTATNIHLFNDRFGVWNCVLNDQNTTSIFTYASQKKAVLQNLKTNGFSTEIDIKHPLDNLKNVELALLKIPKSLELFELFLQQIHKGATDKTEVICCFMTKYFSSSFLKIVSVYFDDVQQSKAWKKARLLILKSPKQDITYKNLINYISFNDKILQQYYGVFSSSKIDIGTQFLLEHLKLNSDENCVLDLACGNGVIAHELAEQNPSISVSLIDDFNLAIASAEINLENFNANYIWDNSLEKLETDYFDLVVSNPPFHFEHENNIEVSLSLFKDVKRILKNNGRFVLVANKHLNYKTHLSKIFNTIIILDENEKFVIYECK